MNLTRTFEHVYPNCFFYSLTHAQYLELKARGRTSTMFGDASLTPEERKAKDEALRKNNKRPKATVACGSDFPGAFNVGGPAGAAAAAAAQVLPDLPDVFGVLPNGDMSSALFKPTLLSTTDPAWMVKQEQPQTQ